MVAARHVLAAVLVALAASSTLLRQLQFCCCKPESTHLAAALEATQHWPVPRQCLAAEQQPATTAITLRTVARTSKVISEQKPVSQSSEQVTNHHTLLLHCQATASRPSPCATLALLNALSLSHQPWVLLTKPTMQRTLCIRPSSRSQVGARRRCSRSAAASSEAWRMTVSPWICWRRQQTHERQP